ncbi:MAG: PilZ domain-containing protein [Lachnospiraceae bacterium]|nr:PilZ domain-containing protein [Lachnospiraceae bacterium]
MFVEELEPGVTVELVIKRTDKLPLHLNTTVKENNIEAKIRHFCLLEPCFEGEALINPNGFSADVELNYLPPYEEGKNCRVQSWAHVNLKYLTDIKSYIVLTNNMSKEVNRRIAYRVELGLPAVVRVGENQKTYECTVHDVSIQGVSVTMQELDYNPVGMSMSVVFFEEATGTNFRIFSVCVRMQNVGRNLWRYGCQFTKAPPELAAYVYRKQREEMAKRSGNEKKTLT